MKRIKVGPSTPLPNNWKIFLCINDNKKKALFKLIADEVENIVVPNGKAFVIKSEDRALVKGNIRQKDFSIVSIYQKEEADPRVCIHVKCMLSYGHKNVLIATVDTVVAVSLFNQLLSLGFEQLWI